MSLRSRLRATWTQFVSTAVVPRIRILRLLPVAGAPLISVMVLINVVLGLLPVGFIFATSQMIGKVPSAVEGGVGSPAWDSLVESFVLAAILFLIQQVLAPIQTALGLVMRRRVDGVLRDRTMRLVMSTTGIGPMEDQRTLDALANATRQFNSDWHTPGMACAGLLALVARYVRLLALCLVIGFVASWSAAAAVGIAAMTFRYGQRGGLRKYSTVWDEVTPKFRELDYLWELGTSDAVAKEARVFGLTNWLVDRCAQVYWEVFGRVAMVRRKIYLRPFYLFTAVGLVLSSGAILAVARAGIDGRIDLTGLALGLQAVMGGMMAGHYYGEADVPTQYGMMAMKSMADAEDRFAEAASGEIRSGDLVDPAVPRSSIRFEKVSFAYPGTSSLVLDQLDLELPAGKCTAVVGVNGAGKTTLVKLLTRLYEPTSGSIIADGNEISSFDVDAWRRQVGVIFQDFTRYEFSAADNIVMGAAHADPDLQRVTQAAARAGILAALEELPLGIETTLARSYQGGVDLSGGQWQRIAIARALYALDRGARVLILDEPTAALDVRAEVAFFDRFVELTEGVTSMLISHRFSSVRRADRIVVIDAGRAIEEGTHEELLKAGGHYARLFRLQAERFAAGLDAEGNEVDALESEELEEVGS